MSLGTGFSSSILYRKWKELVNASHLHILLCHVEAPIMQSHAFPFSSARTALYP
jgi:hypothetical protein